MLREDLELDVRERRDHLRRLLDRRRFRTEADYFEALVNRAIAAGQSTARPDDPTST